MKPKAFHFKDHLMYYSEDLPAVEHKHLAAHLIFSLKEPLDWTLNGRSVRAHGVYIDANVSHKAEGTGKYLVFLFTNTSFYAHALRQKFLTENGYGILNDAFSHRIEQLYSKHWDEPETLDKAVMSILELPVEPECHYDERIQEAIRFVEASETIVPNMLTLLSRNVCLSESRFSHLFKEETKMTVNSYLSYEKLRKTFHLILSGKNITESCMIAGFDSPSHCATTSKKLFGISLKKIEMN